MIGSATLIILKRYRRTPEATDVEEQSPKPRRLRLWPAFVVLLVLVLICLALPIYEGKRHQRIGKELTLIGCSVDYSHYDSVWGSHSNMTYSGLYFSVYKDHSSLPEFIRSLSVERITRVYIDESKDLPIALSLLKQLREYNSLTFRGCGVTGSQLEEAIGKMQIESLSIAEAQLPTTNMPWLNKEGMTALNVNRTRFSNPAIDDLPYSLEWLNATRTRINDDGLDSFVRLKNMKELRLRRTPTSEEAIEKLRKKMPWCKIEWEPLVNR